jgi:SAM-dependent methyltransferase
MDSGSGPLGLNQLTEHARRNRTEWTEWSKDFVEPGREAWASDAIWWGAWRVPESDLRVLPDVEDCDVLELGCGTAYWSAWLTRLGARVTGLDVTEAQLETARRFQREFGVEFPLVHGSAEALPFRDESFDLVFSEYGASIWCDPYLWVPEATRVLRAGGRLLFLVNGTVAVLCMPDDEEAIEPAGTSLLRDYFGLHRIEWTSDDRELLPRLRRLDPAPQAPGIRPRRTCGGSRPRGSASYALERDHPRVGATMAVGRDLERG